MHDQLIKALLAKGWSYPIIARQSGINEDRLRSGRLGVREQRRLAEMAWRDAKIDIDTLDDQG
ncbi:hypothetical protein D3C85_274400 [compost metagenome]